MHALTSVLAANAWASECPARPNAPVALAAPSPTLDLKNIGLRGDGKSDNTEVFAKLLSTTGQTIHIPKGNYVTGRLMIPANTTLILDAGTILRDSGKLGPNERLINIRADDVRIIGNGAKILANRADYSTGEQRHGVHIWGAHNVYIDGIESSGHGGDGFYIGGPDGNPSSNVTLDNVVADNNRRQGLSITSARNVDVLNSKFTRTNGTPPQYGVDIEPNKPGDAISDIRLQCIRTHANEGGGILIELKRLDRSSAPVAISIHNHESDSERVSLVVEDTENAPGLVTYSDSKSTNAGIAGILLLNTAVSGTRIEIKNPEIANNNVKGTSSGGIGSAITIRSKSGVSNLPRPGNIHIDSPSIIETRAVPQVPYPIWVQGDAGGTDGTEGIVIRNLNVRGTRNPSVHKK